MPKATIDLLSKNTLEIIEFPSGHYSYTYRQKGWCRRRWEWHKKDKKGPHVHDYLPLGSVEKFETEKYGLEEVLKEIKKEFEPNINVQAVIRMVRQK